MLDEVVDRALAGRDRIALGDLAALPPALARLVVRRLAEDATGALCARAASRLGDVLALGDEGALDVGDGARAVVELGVLRFERTPPLPGADPSSIAAPHEQRHRSARSSSSPTSSRSACGRSDSRSPRTTRAATCCSSAC